MAVKARDDVTLAALSDVSNVRRYYLLQSSTLNPPPAPTTNPAPSPWSTVEPTYTEGSTTTLYTVDLTVFSDGTFDYSPVSKSAAFEASKMAYNKALSAVSTANAALAAVPPFIQQATPNAIVVGQLWFPTDSSGRVIGMKRANAIGTGGWVDYLFMAGKILVPGTVGTTEVGPDGILAANIKASSELWAKIATFAKVTTDMLIAGRAKITGTLLADVITLATKLVAGNVELDPQGFHVFRTLLDGQRAEAIRLGVNGSPDYLQIQAANGTTLAAISDGGGASFTSADVGQSLTYQGNELSDLMGGQSKGIVAWGGGWPWGGQITHALSTDESICDLTVDLDASRMYSLGVELGWTSSNDSAALEARIRMTSTTDGTTPPSPTSSTSVWGYRRFSGLKSGQSRQDSVHGWQFTPNTSGTYRLLLSAAPAYVSTGATLSYTTAIPRIYIRDEGPALLQMTNASSVMVPSGTTASTPSAVKRWIRDYSCSWGQSYRADGTMYSGMDPYVIQGYGGGPGRMGMLGFQTMTADLSGASINAMYVYLYFQHWWASAGGTAVIGVHGQASKPATYSASDGVVSRSGWPNPGGLWVPLPTQVWNGFKAGTYRGVSVRAPGDSTAAEYYGYIDPSQCKIRIDFNK